MTAEWDIVSDVFPGPQIVENTANARRVSRVPSSTAVAVFVALCAAGASTPALTPMFGGVSTGLVVLSREAIVPVCPPRERAYREADFSTARSAEQLAKSFEAFFRPAPDRDGGQVPYVFS